MKQLTINPIQSIVGEVRLPGSKSLTNRALLLSALASGTTNLENPLASDDTLRMMQALAQLGVTISTSEGSQTTVVTGNGGLFDTPQNDTFFLGNAGTAYRPLAAILSLIPGTFVVDGDEYMHERPIAHLADALAQLGAEMTYLGKTGFPPVKIRGGCINGGEVSVPGHISSQYLTSLLMALPLASNDSVIHVVGDQVSKPYLDITIGIMAQFGVTVSHEDYQHFFVPAGQVYKSPGRYLIEGDASSASYFFAAAAIKGETTVRGIGRESVQGDIQFLDTIEQMGATVRRDHDSITVSKGTLQGIDVDLNHIPDAAMTIAVMALFAGGPTRIRNVYNWRVKETDRMTAMATELRKLGAEVSTTDDSISITPPAEIQQAQIDTYGDHRIAMCFSLAALGGAPVTINDPDCTAKTFPDYFSVFAAICHS
jgi:3-phosphoshikimate 1-carboxyvinyltransferase